MNSVRENKLTRNKGLNFRAKAFDFFTFISILIAVLVIYPNYIYAENAEQKISLQQWNNPKEYSADLNKSGHLFWCGENVIGLVKHLSRDKASMTFYKSDLSDVQEDILNINAPDYDGFSCSDDTQYIYYTHLLDGKENREFGYYDRKKKKFSRVFIFDKNLSIRDTAKIISPQHNYIVGPKGIDKLFLPGIGNVKVIPINLLIDNKENDRRFALHLAWDHFERRLFLFYRNTITYVEPKTLKKQEVELDRQNKYEITGIEASSNPNRPFIIAITTRGFLTKIYQVNLADKKHYISLFLSDIYTFDASQTGILIYAKRYGYEEEGGDEYFETDPAKRYVTINLIDYNNNKKRLKKIHFGTALHCAYIFGPSGDPIINKNGRAVAFINENEKKIYVIRSN